MQTQTQAPTQEMEKVSFSSAAFAVHTCEPRQHKRKSKKEKKKTGSIDSPYWFQATAQWSYFIIVISTVRNIPKFKDRAN